MPLGLVVEGREFACGDVPAARAFSLVQECLGLAGAGAAEEHVGMALLEIFQWQGRLF